jgi:hypothetical protein
LEAPKNCHKGTKKVGESPQLNWWPQVYATKATKPSRVPRTPRVISSQLPLTQISEDNSNRCTKYNGKSTQSAQILLTQILRKQLHKELQDLDPIGSPHLEEILIGGKIDLDLLSLFSQEDARIIGGIER